VTARLAEISARLGTVRQLDLVVGAMRGMAAARAQQSRNLLPAILGYAELAAQAMAQALTLLPEGEAALQPQSGSAGLVAFCGEQGFAGAFTERVLGTLDAERGDACLFLIGSRGIARAAERGMHAAWSAPMASHVDGLSRLARALGEAIYAAVRGRGLSRVEVLLPNWTQHGGLRVERHSLLPLDRRRFPKPIAGQPPLVHLPPAALVEGLAEEYVHALLYEAVAIAFAAENEARVSTMASARSNIERMLSELAAQERQVRQDSITAEVIELAAGARHSRS
jgi:F-type H+-transporting ATPase subunit gamma